VQGSGSLCPNGFGLKGGGITETARIAIVDDDRWTRNSLERLLKSVGFRTESFASAEDYLDPGDHGGIGCIILDVLSGISGFGLDRALAAQHNRVPVVFVSARDEQEARQEAAQAGAIGFRVSRSTIIRCSMVFTKR
jgi:FixJ family two-component response regulator